MTNISVVSFNLRVTVDDGINSWPYRKSHVMKRILMEKPDVIGFQELTEISLNDLKESLTDYVFIGCGRNKDYTGEAVMLAYHQKNLDLVSLDVIWLSDTPKIAGSRFCESSVFPRYYSVAVFKLVQSNELFRVYNTHYDHESNIARIKSSKQLLNDLKATQETLMIPTFLMGDLNATPNAEEITMLEGNHEIPLTDLTQTLSCTFHDYGKRKAKIDYIFATEGIQCTEVSVWDECHAGVYLSDHYPVVVNVNF